MKKIYLSAMMSIIFVLLLGSVANVHADEDIAGERTPVNTQDTETNWEEKNVSRIEVIKINYVNAEDVANVLAPLFSEYGRIIPYKPTNSIIIKNGRKSTRD